MKNRKTSLVRRGDDHEEISDTARELFIIEKDHIREDPFYPSLSGNRVCETLPSRDLTEDCMTSGQRLGYEGLVAAPVSLTSRLAVHGYENLKSDDENQKYPGPRRFFSRI